MLKKIAKKTRSYGLSKLPVFKGSDPLVLCFHTVNSFEKRRGYVSAYRSQPLTVFDSQLEWLSTFCDFVSLGDVLEHVGKAASGRQKIAITFDDGYRDNLYSALPILEKYNAPVTLFVATDYIQSKRLPWWDFMDWTIENKYVWDAAKNVIEKGEMSAARAASQRHLFRTVCRDGDQLVRDRIMSNLSEQTSCRETNDFMSDDELVIYSQHPLTSIGAHTHNHFNTSVLEIDELSRNMERNLEILAATNTSSIDYFAYPYGGRTQVNNDAAAILQRLGMKAAFTTEPKCVTSESGKFELPRTIISPRNNLTEFKSQINTVLLKNKFPQLSVF